MRTLGVLALLAILGSGCGDDAGGEDLSAVPFDLAVALDLRPPADLRTPPDAGVACPTGTVPPSTNTLFAGDTTGGKNLATDARLSWAANPDAALLFVAPQAGTWRVSITSSDQPTTNDCGVVVRDYSTSNNGALYDEAACPPAGGVKALDAAYAATPGGATYDVSLTASQHLLMWVSCSQFASPVTFSYVVHVALQ